MDGNTLRNKMKNKFDGGSAGIWTPDLQLTSLSKIRRIGCCSSAALSGESYPAAPRTLKVIIIMEEYVIFSLFYVKCQVIKSLRVIKRIIYCFLDVWKMRHCIRCGRRLKKSEKLKMCERCRKDTVRQFLTQTLDDIEETRIQSWN